MRSRALAMASVLASAVASSDAAAQRLSASLDAGAASTSYDGYLRAGVAAVAPRFQFATAQGTIDLEGALSRFEGGSHTAALAGTVGVPLAEGPRWHTDLGASGQTSWYSDRLAGQSSPEGLVYGSANVKSGQGEFRVARTVLAEPRGVQAGAWGVARGGIVVGVPGDGIVARGGVGAWARYRGADVGTEVTSGQGGRRHYTDVVGRAGWARGGAAYTASIGTRRGDFGGGVSRWADGSAIVALAPRVSLLVAGGQQPSSPDLGTPGSRYVAAGLRVTGQWGGSRTTAQRSTPAGVADPSRRGDGPDVSSGAPVAPDAALSVTLAPDGRRTLRLRVAATSAVELRGDFTGWTPVPLASVGNGLWEVTLPIAPGAHELDVRLDGGAWAPPPGLPSTPDDFGGRVAVLVVR